MKEASVQMPLLDEYPNSAVKQQLSASLRRIGRMVPPWLPRGTAVGNRLLKPIYRRLFGPQLETVELWPPIRAKLNPCEAVGGNLFFSPQLYDRQERHWLQTLLRPNSVFVDVGANLGAYTLWAAQFLSSSGIILAIEADPDTFQLLHENVRTNTRVCQIFVENVGVSDDFEELKFFRSTANAGGNSFFARRPESTPWITLNTEPLFEVVRRHGLSAITLMKVDIEGFELKVLSKFFRDCELYAPQLKPRHLVAETDEGPRRRDKAYMDALAESFRSAGYRIEHWGKNTLYTLDMSA